MDIFWCDISFVEILKIILRANNDVITLFVEVEIACGDDGEEAATRQFETVVITDMIET